MARNHGNGDAGTLQQAGFVCPLKTVGLGFRKRPEHQADPCALGRLSLHNALPRNGRRDDGAIGGTLYLLDRIDCRHANDGCTMAGNGLNGALNRGRIDQRAHGVVHQNNVVRLGDQGTQRIGDTSLAMVSTNGKLNTLRKAMLGKQQRNMLLLRRAQGKHDGRNGRYHRKRAHTAHQHRLATENKKLLGRNTGHRHACAQACRRKNDVNLHRLQCRRFPAGYPCVQNRRIPAFSAAPSARTSPNPTFRAHLIALHSKHFDMLEAAGTRRRRSNALAGMRIGYGFDSHAFKPGVPLVIGGMKIEHTEGLAGHSDGDVLLHAITDALLGAVSAGDIGTFFPPSDDRWKGADSSLFLQTALEEVATAGYRIVNIDSVLILQRPKIVPIAGDMRERVAELLGVPARDVGIKAKTPEGLNQDGVAVAHVTVLLEAIAEPDVPKRMTAEIEDDAEVEVVVRTLMGEAHDLRRLGRKPAFDSDDLT